MMNETLPELLIARELAEWLRVKCSTAYSWAASGKIPSVKLNGSVRFIRTQIQQWLDDRSNHLAGAPPSPSRVIVPPKIAPVSRHTMQHIGVRAIRQVTNRQRGQPSLGGATPLPTDIATPKKRRT